MILDLRQAERAEPILETKDLRVRYRNGALGIVSVSLSVAPGEVVGLFGANGAGKTSTARAMSGFLKTEGTTLTGQVTLDGHQIVNSEPHRAVKHGLFLIPERQKIFPNLSVWENLMALGSLPRGARKQELLEFVFDLFPVLTERRRSLAGLLSGGQRQMLALGRGILSDSKVLIVDEMTLGLHHSLHPPLFRAVRSIANAGTAVVVVDESAGNALGTVDYCYVLSAGHIGSHGTADRFRDSELLAASYVEAK